MSIAFEHVDGWPIGPPIGEHLTEVFEELGYEVTTTAVPDEELPTSRFQMALTGWGPAYPAASTFFDGLLTCEKSFPRLDRFCDPEIDAMIERAKRMQVEDPVAAGELWAEVDRAIVDQAPYLWLVNPVNVAITSDRVGNFQRNFNWGILLNQIWVR
jgi:peptide/nickel transport system substrate-binding protein